MDDTKKMRHWSYRGAPACGQDVELKRGDAVVSLGLNVTCAMCVEISKYGLLPDGGFPTRAAAEAWLRDKVLLRLERADAGSFEELRLLTELLGEDLLDGLVHDVKSEEAASINNDGKEAQVRFLLDSGFTREDLLRELSKEDEDGD